MTPGPELTPTCTAARPLLLSLRKLRLRRQAQGRWRGRLPGVTQVRAARLLVTAPHAHLTHVPKTVFLSFGGGEGCGSEP